MQEGPELITCLRRQLYGKSLRARASSPTHACVTENHSGLALHLLPMPVSWYNLLCLHEDKQEPELVPSGVVCALLPLVA